jgi:hypothetical protein
MKTERTKKIIVATRSAAIAEDVEVLKVAVIETGAVLEVAVEVVKTGAALEGAVEVVKTAVVFEVDVTAVVFEVDATEADLEAVAVGAALEVGVMEMTEAGVGAVLENRSTETTMEALENRGAKVTGEVAGASGNRSVTVGAEVALIRGTVSDHRKSPLMSKFFIYCKYTDYLNVFVKQKGFQKMI